MSKWSENPMKYYFDWSASIMFLMFLVHLPKTPFKFDNKDTELNPVITGANINLFLTFPRAQISLITSMLFSYLANKINKPLWSHWHIFPSPEQSMFPWVCSGRSHSGNCFPFCLEWGLGMLMCYHQSDKALMCGPDPGYVLDMPDRGESGPGATSDTVSPSWKSVWKSYVHNCPE